MPSAGHDDHKDAGCADLLCAYASRCTDGFRPKGPKRAGSWPCRMNSPAHVLWASMYLHPRKIKCANLSVYEPGAPDSGYTPLAGVHGWLNSVVGVQSRLATGTVVVCALLPDI